MMNYQDMKASHDAAISAMEDAKKRMTYLLTVLGEAIEQLGGTLEVDDRVVMLGKEQEFTVTRNERDMRTIFQLKQSTYEEGGR